ncbi:MAG: FprA family A-type flavoprotein [Atribacterota bacterium]|nr:FprA family A-type flavoprotein [Atribacterota bacterium]MDD5636359.1 FprA family A-type flavoprotein [Atribacterota bacterium]
MAIKKILKDIYFIGTIDWDRRLFDELIPLPDGTSYNSYLIKNQKEGLLIDTVDPSKKEEFFQNIKESQIEKISYIIAQHAEQDHAGCIREVLNMFPGCKVITNRKCQELLIDELHLEEENFIEIKDKDTFVFGNKEFHFFFAPWVHWPETFLTYLPKEKILFTCDLFGSHLASSELWSSDNITNYLAAKRYYAEIMMPFRQNIQNHLQMLKKLTIAIIAPSHGPVYEHPDFILKNYQEWVSDSVRNEVVIPYVSMHGSTEAMVNYLVEQLISRGARVTPYHLTNTDIGELAMALVEAATIILASPTVLTGPHPQIAYAAYLCHILRPKARFVGIIGSFGWGSKMEHDILQIISNLKVDLLTSVISKSFPRAEDFRKLDKLVNQIILKHKTIQ